MTEKFVGQLYESMGSEQNLYGDYDEDFEKIKIINDTILAMKNVKSFDLGFVEKTKDNLESTGMLSGKQYNALVKIYYKWHVENRLANIYKNSRM